MEDTSEHERTAADNNNDSNNATTTNTNVKDDGAQYVDCIRFVEGGHVRRFENTVAKFDVVQYELNDGPSKSLLFYAIEHSDEVFVKVLLEMEVPLNKSYSVSIEHIYICMTYVHSF